MNGLAAARRRAPPEAAARELRAAKSVKRAGGQPVGQRRGRLRRLEAGSGRLFAEATRGQSNNAGTCRPAGTLPHAEARRRAGAGLASGRGLDELGRGLKKAPVQRVESLAAAPDDWRPGGSGPSLTWREGSRGTLGPVARPELCLVLERAGTTV